MTISRERLSEAEKNAGVLLALLREHEQLCGQLKARYKQAFDNWRVLQAAAGMTGEEEGGESE